MGSRFLGAALVLLAAIPALDAQSLLYHPSSVSVAAEVRIANFRFTADSVTIHVGEAVRWTNGDHVGHTITFEGGGEGSPPVPDGTTFTHRFEKPGVYRYHCTPHPYMKGVVVVR